MPSTVGAVLEAAGLASVEVVSWGTRPECRRPGVYVVALSASPQSDTGLGAAPISPERVTELLEARGELTVDGLRPDADGLLERLRRMWVPNEPILYVGRASTSIADRVNAYYRTRLGARAPHAGGWPLKTLSNLDGLSVHVAPTDDPAAAETAMIDAFVAGVPKPTSDLLVDPALPLPFANLEDGRGRRKAHGIRGARAPYARKAADREMASPARIKAHALQERSVIDGVVLNVTAKDLEKGQIRITRPAKALLDLPERASEVRVYLRGQTLIASWDARLGPDKERSGLFRVGREKLKAVLGSDSMQLTMRIDRDGAIHLD